MTLIPAFEIGVWNAWILWVLHFLSMLIPNFFMSEEAKIRTKRAPQFVPFHKKREKILALSTHVVIMPFSLKRPMTSVGPCSVVTNMTGLSTASPLSTA